MNETQSIWSSAQKFRSRRRPAYQDSIDSKQLVPDFSTGAIDSDEISMYAKKHESEEQAAQTQNRIRRAKVKLSAAKAFASKAHKRPPANSAASSRDLAMPVSLLQMPQQNDGAVQTNTGSFIARGKLSRPSTSFGPKIVSPGRGSPAFHATRHRTRRCHTATLSANRYETTPPQIEARASSQDTHVRQEQGRGPYILPESKANDSDSPHVPASMVQTILGSQMKHLAKSPVTSHIPMRPAQHVPPPSALQKGRAFRVATPASIQPVPFPHVAARLETGAQYDIPVDQIPAQVKGSYSDLVPPDSVLAAPPANFSPLTVLDRLSRPASRAASPGGSIIPDILSKSKLLESSSKPGGRELHASDDHFQVVSNSDFWTELDQFSLGLDTTHRDAAPSSAPQELYEEISSQSQSYKLHSPNLGSHRSGSAAKSLISPLALLVSQGSRHRSIRRNISQTLVGVGVELPSGDWRAMHSVQSAQQRLERSFQNKPGQHSAGDAFVVGPRGSSACPTIPANQALRKDGLVFNKLPSEGGPVHMPLLRGQSPPGSPGSFHSPLNKLSLRQREGAARMLLQSEEALKSSSKAFLGVSTQFDAASAAMSASINERRSNTDAQPSLKIQATAVEIPARQRSASDVSISTGVGSTRGGTSVSSPVSRLRTYGRRNSLSHLSEAANGHDESTLGTSVGKTRADTSDGYENAASNGFYAGLRRAGSFVGDEVSSTSAWET